MYNRKLCYKRNFLRTPSYTNEPLQIAEAQTFIFHVL